MSSHAEKYKPHSHVPVNVTETCKRKHATASINTKLAIAITRGTGTMLTAYLFAVLAIIGLLGLLGWLNPFVFLLTTWISQQFLQLVLLPIILVGQNKMGEHQEEQSTATYHTSIKTYHDGEIAIKQNNEQLDLLKIHTELLENHYKELTKQTEMLTTLLAPPVTIRRKVRKQEVGE